MNSIFKDINYIKMKCDICGKESKGRMKISVGANWDTIMCFECRMKNRFDWPRPQKVINRSKILKD